MSTVDCPYMIGIIKNVIFLVHINMVIKENQYVYHQIKGDFYENYR